MTVKNILLISTYILFFTPVKSDGAVATFFSNLIITKNLPPEKFFIDEFSFLSDKFFNSDTNSSTDIDTIFNNNFSYKYNDIEEAYFIFTYQNIVKKRIIVLYRENSFFLPIIEILKSLEINYSLNIEEKTINGFFLEEDSTFKFDFYKLIYEDKNKSFRINEMDFIDTPIEIYINPELLKKSFGFNFELNINDLTINLKSYKQLPVYNRIIRERNYRYLNNKEIYLPDYTFLRAKKLFAGAFLDYYLSSNYSKGLPAYYNYSLGLGSVLLGGDIEISLDGSLIKNYNSINNYSHRWRYVFDNKNITQFLLGTIQYFGLQQSEINGISITNEPIEPRTSYYNYLIADKSGPNWTIELYINDRLTDVTKADANGNFHFNIPLNYGTSFVTLKQYSPTGQYVVNKKLFQIPLKFLPPGEFNYTFSFGKLNYSNDQLGQIYGIYGFNDWLTSSIGLEYFKNGNTKKLFFYNELFARINSSYTLSLLFAPQAYYRLNFNALFYSQMLINFFFTKYHNLSIYNPFNIKNEFNSELFIPIDFSNYSVNIGLSTKIQNSSEFSNQNYSFNLGIRSEFINPSISYKSFYSKYKKYIFRQSFMSFGFLLPLRNIDKWIKLFNAELISFQFNYDTARKRLVQYNIAYSAELFPNSRLQLSYNNNVINSTSYFQAVFVFDLPFTKSWSTMSNTSIYNNIYGAIAYDINTNDYSFYNRPLLGKTAVTCRLFIDENGNNKYDNGEPLINDADITLDTPSSMKKEKDGIIVIRELNPYTTYTLKINESTIKNPLLMPVYKTIAFQTEANSFKIIDIPFYEGQEVYGSVALITKDAKKMLGGIKVVFEDLNDNSKSSINTFADGTFYLYGIKPSTYKVYVDPEQLTILHCQSIPEYFIFDSKQNESNNNEFNFELKIVKDF